MIVIDGSQGEGGGQILRSCLSLSAITGKAIQLENIRGGRSKPGLMRQHQACVRACAEITGACVSGDELKSQCLQFSPGKIRAGDYHFRVGSAGSTTLIAQTILPALMLATAPSQVRIEGGTHNPWAPPFEFFQRAFLPQLQRMGPSVEARLERHGFFPAGGGQIALSITPEPKLRGLQITQRRGTCEHKVTSIVSGIPESVGQRECRTILRRSNWPEACCRVEVVDSVIGPGNIVLIELQYENVTEICSEVGKPGVKAEHVARAALRAARNYLTSAAPVGPHLADQLILLMGIAASQGATSEIVTGKLTPHSTTHLEILTRFLDVDIGVQSGGGTEMTVHISPAT